MRFRISLTAGLLIMAAFVLACNSTEQTASNTRPTTPPTRPVASPGTTGQIPTVHADGVRRITTGELQELLAKNEAVVIDVRNDPSYAAGHIRGAKLIPYQDVVKRAAELPKDKLIVTYCS